VKVVQHFSGSATQVIASTKGQYQPPKGIGPKCSATGPSAAAGRKSNAPTRIMVPNKTHAKVNVSVRMVPTVKGVDFFFAKLPARAKGAIMGMKRLKSITRPVAMSSGWLSGAGGEGLSSGLLNPHVSPKPSKPEPLLAEDEVN
jgi:hypothetical protein